MRNLNLLVSGCSFTGPGFHDLSDGTWSLPLARLGNITNLAVPGAGNEYIADSVINHVLSGKPVDMVLVMWTGLQRQDFLIDPAVQDDHKMPMLTVRENVRFSPAGGMQDFPSAATARAKKEMFTIGNELVFAYRGLMQIIKLEHFLKARGIPYLFMSYINYWNDEDYIVNSNFGVNKYHTLAELAKSIDFSNWVFYNDHRDGYYEVAKELNSFCPDGFHPAWEAMKKWADIVTQHIERKLEKK